MASKSNKNKKEEKNLGGRPPKYKDEFPQMLHDYFSEGYIEHEKFPTKAGFSIFIDVCHDTLNEWNTATIKDDEGNIIALKYPEFSAAYKKCEKYQERLIVGNCLTNEFNPTFGIFFAKCNLGYKDVQYTDNEHNIKTENSKQAHAAIDALTGNTHKETIKIKKKSVNEKAVKKSLVKKK